jgi:high potential iron-sulfur protein
MKQEARDVLDLRLAKGEICAEEYRELLRALADGEPEAGPAVLQEAKSFASKAVERAFSGPSTEAPTNAAPWVLTNDLVLYGDHLVHKGQTKNYSAISSVNYHAFRNSVNYIPTNVQNALELVFDDGDKVSIRSLGVFIETGKNKRVSSACYFLSWKTFQQRVRLYQDLLKNPGYFEIRNVFSHVRIYANGDIEKNGLRLSIARASEHRALQFGTEWGTSLSGGKNPYAIVVGETGTGFFSRKIKFAVTKDQDVVSSLVQYFANEHVTVWGYSDYALNVDKAKYPKYALGQHCANCLVYQPEAGHITGQCRAFGGKAVASSGWCNFWGART